MARLRRSPAGSARSRMPRSHMPHARVPRSRLPLPRVEGLPIAVSVALLRIAEDTNSESYYAAIVDGFNDSARRYAVDTPLRIAHFLAQIGHESSFRATEENGRYGAVRMRQVFGCKGGQAQYDAARDECRLGPDGQPLRLRPKLWSDSDFYAGNAEHLLGYVYADRLGNGSEASGDGFRYRGRGLIQLTGKDNYTAFTRAHNARDAGDPRDFVLEPNLLVSELKYAVESAFYYWDARKVNALADTDDLEAVTRAINGGLNGLPDRGARLAKIKKALGI